MHWTQDSEATFPQEWYHRAVGRIPSILGLACPVLPLSPAKETAGQSAGEVRTESRLDEISIFPKETDMPLTV